MGEGGEWGGVGLGLGRSRWETLWDEVILIWLVAVVTKGCYFGWLIDIFIVVIDRQ